MRRPLVLCAVAGCAYNPGSFVHPQVAFVGQRATAGCLDVAIDRRPDPPQGGAVIGYAFGNRCDHPAPVDLRSVNVIGRTTAGNEVELVPFDPAGELHPLSIDGRWAGTEAIAYPSSVAIAQVCVDVASLTNKSPAQWLCAGSSAAEAP